jgi:hypothetical protein
MRFVIATKLYPEKAKPGINFDPTGDSGRPLALPFSFSRSTLQIKVLLILFGKTVFDMLGHGFNCCAWICEYSLQDRILFP